MDHNDVNTLIRFNFWANDRLLATCERLSLVDFTRPVEPDPGWGSLRGVLVHILDTEFGWRAVLQAQDADTVLEAEDFENVADLRTRWEEERAAWFEFVGGLKAEDLARDRNPESSSGIAIWQTILHVVTHGIQHRAEAAWILTGLGYSPGELDFDVFLQQNPA